MTKYTISPVMSAFEALEIFTNNPELVAEYYADCPACKLKNPAPEDLDIINDFLENDAEDIERLNPSVCEFLGLEYDYGWYVDTFNSPVTEEEI